MAEKEYILDWVIPDDKYWNEQCLKNQPNSKKLSNFKRCFDYYNLYTDGYLEKSLDEIKSRYELHGNVKEFLDKIIDLYTTNSREIGKKYILKHLNQFITQGKSGISLRFDSYALEYIFRKLVPKEYKINRNESTMVITTVAFIDTFSELIPDFKDKLYSEINEVAKQESNNVIDETVKYLKSSQPASKKFKNWYTKHKNEIDEIFLQAILFVLKAGNYYLDYAHP